ncbi:lamin tail domain-containing protein [bacterium]|nr:lamin tail domain-containing protein [bacterium]
MKNIFAQFISLLLSIATLGISPNFAHAYFGDKETSQGNIITAAMLDFFVEQGESSDAIKRYALVSAEGNGGFIYHASGTDFTGDLDFCVDLLVLAELYGSDMFNGDLVSLLSVSTTTEGLWEFSFLASGEHANKVCGFDIVFEGMQDRHSGGFSDSELVSDSLVSAGFRVSKVYADVSPERGEERDNEWVEIYNQAGTPLPLEGFKICDNTSCDTLSGTTTISAHGFAVVTPATSTRDFWHIPDDIPLIALGGPVGNGLGNSEDMLLLKRPDGMVIDAVNWGTPKTTWTNWHDGLWDPGATSSPEGEILSRIPHDTDTDTRDDWTNLMPPEIQFIAPSEEETWTAGATYDIRWIAENNNGPSTDLLIDLYYLSEGVRTPIVNGSENDGSELWTVPEDLAGEIRLYIAATGAENPLLNTPTISPLITILTPEAEEFTVESGEPIVVSEEVPPSNDEPEESISDQDDEQAEEVSEDEDKDKNSKKDKEDESRANSEHAALPDPDEDSDSEDGDDSQGDLSYHPTVDNIFAV